MANDFFGNFQEAVWNAIRSAVRVGVVGRKEADGTTTITVDGRDHYIYVRTGATATGGEILEAYNKGIPRLAGAPCLLLKWNRVWTVVGVDSDSPAVTANIYSVAFHEHRRDNGLVQSVHDLDGMPSTVAGRAGALLRVNDTADGYYLADATTGTGTVDSVNGETGAVTIDADDIDDTATTNKFATAAELTKLAGIETAADVTDAGNVGSSIDGATAKATPVDADTMPLIDSAAANVLKKVTWANIKATLKTYFDTLYVALTGNQTIAGVKTFSGSIVAQNGMFLTGNIYRGIYSPSVDYGFYTGSNVEVLGNAYFDGAYKRYIVGKATKFAVTSAGSWFVSNTDTSGAADTAITFADRIALLSNGDMGLGTITPQGRQHIYDGTSGKLFVTKTGVVGSEVTIVPDGTGDVTRGFVAKVFATGSGGSEENPSSLRSLITPAAASVETDVFTAGLLKLKLYSTGQLVVYRGSGAETWSVTLDIIWQ
jgi:hypothetical protein